MSLGQQAIIERQAADIERLEAALTMIAAELPQPFFRSYSKEQIENALKDRARILHGNGGVVVTTNS